MWGRASSVSHGNQSARAAERFQTRRRIRHRRISLGLGIMGVVVCGGVLVALNQPFARISDIQVFGTTEPIASLVEQMLAGSYFGLIPKSTTLLYPEHDIRSAILTQYPGVAAVSFFRTGFTGLSIRVTNRAPIAAWCGAAPLTSTTSEVAHEACYFFDASGVLYATTTATVPVNTFRFYEPIRTQSALMSVLPHAATLPSLFDFARQLSTFDTMVERIVIRDSEVDMYLASGTRITSVLGEEQQAYAALVSAQSSLNLADGSLEYVDVRFGGKVYAKKGEARMIEH